MASEEKLLELLRRAHTIIGEGLIDNALDDGAEELHHEIAAVLGIPAEEHGAGKGKGNRDGERH